MFKNRSKRQNYRIIKKKILDQIYLAEIDSGSCSTNIFTNSDPLDQNNVGNRDEIPSSGSVTSFSSISGDTLSLADTFNDSDDKNVLDVANNVSVSEKTLKLLNLVSTSENKPVENVDSITFLNNWAITNNVTHTAVTQILKWFKTGPDLSNLPHDARTLLRTPSTTNTRKMGSGEFIYLGFNTICKILESAETEQDTVYLDFNIDGIPIQKSTSLSFWPILCRVYEFSQKPFAVAIFCGTCKPPLKQYLEKFVNDLKDLTGNGRIIKNKHYYFKIRSFCCDAPARSYVKNVKGHNGYFGCDKCMVEGLYHDKRMLFLKVDESKRTDNDMFKKPKTNPGHYKNGETPLKLLRIGLVSTFPVDYMHSICLGVMRKLLHTWVDGGQYYGLARRISVLNNRLLKISKCHWPIDFNRKPRTLTELKRWKATELRQFLLYLGPVILIDILPKHVYSNFILLKYGVTILLNEELNKTYNNYANELLRTFFVNAVNNIYGKSYGIYNMHSVIHLAEDAKLFGSLNGINCFPFENYLGSMKRMIRKSNLPLQQVVRRLCEADTIQKKDAGKSEANIKLSLVISNNVENEVSQICQGVFYKRMSYNGTTFITNSSDSCVYLMSGKVIKMFYIVEEIDEIKIFGKEFKILKPFNSYPTCSSLFAIYEVKLNEQHFNIYKLTDIKCKGLLLPYKEHFVCAPLLHLY